MHRLTSLAMIPMLVLCCPELGWAAAAARVSPTTQTRAVGQNFSIGIYADLPQPVLGWGLDLTYDHAILGMVGSPIISAPWASVTAADGDGLAGLRFSTGISGSNILLATINFTALAEGQTDLVLSVTPDDKSEGFALDPTGFAEMSYGSGQVTVVPEPGAAGLLLIGSMFLLVRPRR